MITFEELVAVVEGSIISIGENLPIRYLVTDSRKPVVSPDSIFFAIKGDRHDGHKYVNELWDLGIQQFVVEDISRVKQLAKKKANIVQVDNALQALQKIAENHRQGFTLDILAITGSNGKTIIKEWLYQLLAGDLEVVRSPKSYNSQLGVALSLWQIQEDHKLAIIEAGISLPGEMINLERMIRPTVGIFTNLGTAHDAGFKSHEQKAAEKAILFENCQAVIYCSDNEDINRALQPLDIPTKYDWGKSEHAWLRVISIERLQNRSMLSLAHDGEDLTVTTAFTDEASIENLIHCISYLLLRGLGPYDIQSRISKLAPVSMRLELKEGNEGSYIIDDSYNNDIAGLRIALNFLGQQKIRKKKTVILSDVLQSGKPEKELYQEINTLLNKKGVDKLIGIGSEICNNKQAFDVAASFYNTTNQFLEDKEKDLKGELILVKGARVFEFERIVEKLQRQVHKTVLEINLDSLTHNLNYYRSKLKGKTKIMAMVKAFGYGSGGQEVANLLQFHRVDYLAVAYADEGVMLREGGVHIPIMVMNPSLESFDKMAQHDLEPEVFSLENLVQLNDFVIRTENDFTIHLKLDTGMHRLGFQPEELTDAIEILKSNDRLVVASVFTHLSAQDEAIHDGFTKTQVQDFEAGYNKICSELQITPLKHAVNTAGIARFKEFHFDMVRLGIGLYGVDASNEFQQELEGASSLKSSISQITSVSKGESIGYSRAGKAQADMRIATIPIGYADGYDRRFGNNIGSMLVNGQKAPVVGNVCMDMTMVDVTDIKAAAGDEVVIFGPAQPISLLAQQIGTIPYEILTNVSERVKRVYITE